MLFRSEDWAIALTVEGKAAVLAERREISNRGGKILRPHKVLDDHKIERVAAARHGAQPVEIKKAPAGTGRAGIGRDRIHASIIADLPPTTSSLGVKLVMHRRRGTAKCGLSGRPSTSARPWVPAEAGTIVRRARAMRMDPLRRDLNTEHRRGC